MAKLTRNQPQTLLAIVQFANKRGGVFPTAKELGDILRIDERATSARIKRIVESQPDCFIKEESKSRIRSINYDKLCTEKETACLLLAIYDKCLDSPTGRVAISNIEKNGTKHSKKQVGFIVKQAIKTEYRFQC